MNDFNNNDWQNFIYLILLLVFMVSGLLARRDVSFAKIMKYLAIWSIIALVAVSLYAYRYEFADFTSRIKGEINPSAAQLTKSGEIVVNLSQDGHYYMVVTINSVPIRFMIDTGASDITLNPDEARRIGIDVRKLVFNRQYQTANGISWGASIILKEMEVAGIKFNNVSASVNSADMGISLLGMSFLRKFKKYEFYQDRLVLTM